MLAHAAFRASVWVSRAGLDAVATLDQAPIPSKLTSHNVVLLGWWALADPAQGLAVSQNAAVLETLITVITQRRDTPWGIPNAGKHSKTCWLPSADCHPLPATER